MSYFYFRGLFKKFDDREDKSKEIKSMFGPSETGINRENLENQIQPDKVHSSINEFSPSLPGAKVES